jgi:hypothetical protein
MQNERNRVVDELPGLVRAPVSTAPWDRMVADAAPCDHIVQLYQDQDFLNRAVCRFAGAALANGEGIILVPTLTHWNAVRPRLEAEGVDVEGAREREQLTVVDADEFLPRFIREAMPDSPVFLGLAADVIGRTQSAAGSSAGFRGRRHRGGHVLSAGGARWDR